MNQNKQHYAGSNQTKYKSTNLDDDVDDSTKQSLKHKSRPKSTNTQSNITNEPIVGFIKSGELDDDDAASDVSTENFNTGERVLLDGKIKAKVAYFGPVHFSHDDDWVGIVFEEPVGKHSGTVADTEYFKCDSMHGLFVRSHRLQRTDSSGHITARVKSPYRLRPKSSASMRSHDLEVEDVFTKAEQTDPLGFYEARAGTVRSPDNNDEINSKLGRLVEEIADGDQVNYSSPWIHSSRTPTPTHKQFGGAATKRMAPSLAKKVATINKAKPYGIAFGHGEMDF